MPYEVKLEQRPALAAAVIRLTGTAGQIPALLGPGYGEIGAYLHNAGIEHEDALVYAWFRRFEPQTEVEAGFTVPRAVAPHGRVVAGELPGGEVVTTLHTGSYASLPMATAALREWMIANGRQPSAGPCEVYLDDPEAVPEARLRTEVFFPLR